MSKKPEKISEAYTAYRSSVTVLEKQMIAWKIDE